MAFSATALQTILERIKTYVDAKAGATYTKGVGIDISNSNVIKAKLKTDTLSSLASSAPSSTANRQYPVQADSDGNLSVNVPWQNDTPTTYQAGAGLSLNNSTFKVKLHTETPSSLNCENPSSTQGRQYPVVLSSADHLSVNVPWNDTWKANSSSQEGYVASASGQANKVWKTDANGNPAWRTESATVYTAGSGITISNNEISTTQHFIRVTTAEFNALPAADKANVNNFYYITDSEEYGTTLSLQDLDNVLLTSLTNGQILQYNSSTQKWVNVDAPSGGASTWSEITNKPFNTVGSGLTVSNNVLTTTVNHVITDTEPSSIAEGTIVYIYE